MPRVTAPPPSGEFQIRLQKPFSGTSTHTIEVIGEPNRSSSLRVKQGTTEKTGDVPKDDVNELMRLVDQLRGFPSHPSKDVYGLDTKLDLNTFEIQWSNEEEDSTARDVVTEIAAETKTTFKEVVQSIEALSRAFATKSSAI